MRAFGKVPNLKGLISEFRAPRSGFRVLDDFELHHEMPYYQDLHCSPYCKSVVCSSVVYIALWKPWGYRFGCVSFSTLKLVVDKGAAHLEALSIQLGWSGDLVSSDCIDL